MYNFSGAFISLLGNQGWNGKYSAVLANENKYFLYLGKLIYFIMNSLGKNHRFARQSGVVKMKISCFLGAENWFILLWLLGEISVILELLGSKIELLFVNIKSIRFFFNNMLFYECIRVRELVGIISPNIIFFNTLVNCILQ